MDRPDIEGIKKQWTECVERTRQNPIDLSRVIETLVELYPGTLFAYIEELETRLTKIDSKVNGELKPQLKEMFEGLKEYEEIAMNLFPPVADDEIRIVCPSCSKKQVVKREEHDPVNAYILETKCPDCAGGDFTESIYLDKNGKHILEPR